MIFTGTAVATLSELKRDRNLYRKYKAVEKALRYLADSPRHPSLHTHKYGSISGPNGEEVFEAYAQQNTPAAYRIFFFYGPGERNITIVAVTPHP